MTAPKIKLYVAVSLDGYLADADGGVGWLDEYTWPEYGYDAFMQTVDTVVVGRATYDQVRGFGVAWPYAGKRTIVLTGRPLDADAPPGVEPYTGHVAPLAAWLRDSSKQDVYLCGGARPVRDFLDAGQLDEIELFVMPLLLGAGIPLFPQSTHRDRLTLTSSRAFPTGVVQMRYTVER